MSAKESWSMFPTVSMGGGRAKSPTVFDQRKMPELLVLNFPPPPTQRCSRTAQENFALDSSFDLIEGHPAFLVDPTNQSQGK